MKVTYLASPVSPLTSHSSRFNKLQEHLGHVLNMHPGVNVGPIAQVERRPFLDASGQERRVEITNVTARPGTPAMYDRRTHNRGLDP